MAPASLVDKVAVLMVVGDPAKMLIVPVLLVVTVLFKIKSLNKPVPAPEEYLASKSIRLLAPESVMSRSIVKLPPAVLIVILPVPVIAPALLATALKLKSPKRVMIKVPLL